MVQELVQELQALFRQASQERHDKELLSISVRKLLRKHPPLAASSFKQDLLNYLQFEAETKCGIPYSAEDLASLATYCSAAVKCRK